MKGTIKRLVVEKNFGFITPDGETKDVFFHATGLKAPLQFSELNLGDIVTFDVEQSDKGPKAVNVARA